MTYLHWLMIVLVAFAWAIAGYQLGVMRGHAQGYQSCLGAMDDDELTTKVWRARR